MKLVVLTLACRPLLPFADSWLQAATDARALRWAAVFRSCPPGRLKNQAPRLATVRPSSLTSLHTATHHSVRNKTVAFQGLRERQRFLRRMPGDRRSEVKEEGRMASARSDWAVNRAGGASPDTHSPEDCLCLASAWGSVPRHERSRSPGSLRARRPAHAANSFRTAIKERRQRVALSMEGN